MKSYISELFISYEENRKISGAMSYLPDIDNDDTLVASMQICGEALRHGLNEEVQNKIQSFKKDDCCAAFILRGLPLDATIPPTPYRSSQSLQSMPLSVAINLGLYDMMQVNPVTYQGENNGHLFRHVVPSKHAVNEKSSHGSTYTLGMHVDNCHLSLLPEQVQAGSSACPEYLSLFGIRCDLTVFTKLALLDQALAQIDAAGIQQLKQADFILKMPDSFADARKFELPILVQDEKGIYYSRFDKEYTVPKHAAAAQAFDKLETALLSTQAVHRLLLQPGDFLIFKNQRVTHSRESFTPRFNGMDRWLLRLFGVHDLTRMQAVDKSKPYFVVA